MENKVNLRAAWSSVKAEVDALGVLLDFMDEAADPHTVNMTALAIVRRLPALVDSLAELETQFDI